MSEFGVPAKVRRETTEDDRARLERGWRVYAALRDIHKSGTQYYFPNSLRNLIEDHEPT